METQHQGSTDTNARLDWHALMLGDSLTSAPTLELIAQAFTARYHEGDATAAVLQRLDTSHSLQCEVTVYFSPAAAALAHQFQATACARPDAHGLTLVAGDPARWRDLFGQL